MTTPTHTGSIGAVVEQALRAFPGRPIDPGDIETAREQVMAALSGTFGMYGKVATVTDVVIQPDGSVRWTVVLSGSTP